MLQSMGHKELDMTEQLNNSKEETDKSLITYILPRLNQEEKDTLNRLITSNEIDLVIKKTPNKQKSSFIGEFYQIFEESHLFFSNHFKQEEETHQSSFYKTVITLIIKPDKDITKKESHRPLTLINTDAIILKVLKNQIQQYAKMIIHHDQMGFISTMQQ